MGARIWSSSCGENLFRSFCARVARAMRDPGEPACGTAVRSPDPGRPSGSGDRDRALALTDPNAGERLRREIDLELSERLGGPPP